MARLAKVLCKLGTKLGSSTPGKGCPRACPVMPGAPGRSHGAGSRSREDAVRLFMVASFEFSSRKSDTLFHDVENDHWYAMMVNTTVYSNSLRFNGVGWIVERIFAAARERILVSCRA